jgi:ribosome-binding factor A
MTTPIRQKRVAERIRQEVSALLQRELKDPRLALATVTRVTIDRELSHADVFVSNLGDADEHQALMDALDSAAGFIRREVGRRVRLRLTPQLEFHWDPGMENVENVARLLDQIAAAAPSPAADDDDDEPEPGR